MNKKLIGHNQPPLQLEDFLILDANGKSTGRIKFTQYNYTKTFNSEIKCLSTNMLKRVINDSEKIGLKAKINAAAGSKNFLLSSH